jgi:hypothetical protein
MCSAFDGIFLYRRSNKTKNDVNIFIPILNKFIIERNNELDFFYRELISMDFPAIRKKQINEDFCV